jgi:FlaA1/EpsC-like NDP-sugar epimerase
MRRSLLLLTWLLTDVALFVAAYALAYFIRVGFIVSTDFPLNLYMQTVLIISPLWLGVMLQLGIFRLTRMQSEQKNLMHILFACVMASALFTLAYYFLHDKFFSRLLLIYAGGINLALTVVWHLAFDAWQRRILRANPPAYPVLIIGINRDTERLIKLLEDRQSPLKPIGILESQGSSLTEIHGVPVLGKLNKLEEVIKQKKPTHLIQCSNLEHTINLISVCRQHKLTYLLMPTVLGVAGGSEEMIAVEGQPMVSVRG